MTWWFDTITRSCKPELAYCLPWRSSYLWLIFITMCTGREWDYVLLSMVRSSRVPPLKMHAWLTEHLGLASDQQLMNIALTRARKGFIIIGGYSRLNMAFFSFSSCVKWLGHLRFCIVWVSAWWVYWYCYHGTINKVFMWLIRLKSICWVCFYQAPCWVVHRHKMV